MFDADPIHDLTDKHRAKHTRGSRDPSEPESSQDAASVPSRTVDKTKRWSDSAAGLADRRIWDEVRMSLPPQSPRLMLAVNSGTWRRNAPVDSRQQASTRHKTQLNSQTRQSRPWRIDSECC